MKKVQRLCNLWPGCSCFETLAQWKREIIDDQDTIHPIDKLEWAETSIFITLACMERHCPDKSQRAYAKRHLQNSFWNYQKSISIMEQ